MRGSRAAATALLTLISVATRAPQAAGPANPDATLREYCVTCHNQRLKTGGLALDALDLADVAPMRRHGKGPAEAAAGRDAPAGRAAGPGDLRQPDRVAGKSWTPPRGAPEPGPSRPAPVEPRGIRERDPRPARLDVDVARCCRRTTRPTGSTTWRTRRAVSPALLQAYLAARGRSARWRSAIRASASAATPTRSARICRRTSSSKGCRSARSAACAPGTRSRSTASTTFRCGCIART